jgi:hypothetical protein
MLAGIAISIRRGAGVRRCRIMAANTDLSIDRLSRSLKRLFLADRRGDPPVVVVAAIHDGVIRTREQLEAQGIEQLLGGTPLEVRSSVAAMNSVSPVKTPRAQGSCSPGVWPGEIQFFQNARIAVDDDIRAAFRAVVDICMEP